MARKIKRVITNFGQNEEPQSLRSPFKPKLPPGEFRSSAKQMEQEDALVGLHSPSPERRMLAINDVKGLLGKSRKGNNELVRPLIGILKSTPYHDVRCALLDAFYSNKLVCSSCMTNIDIDQIIKAGLAAGDTDSEKKTRFFQKFFPRVPRV